AHRRVRPRDVDDQVERRPSGSRDRAVGAPVEDHDGGAAHGREGTVAVRGRGRSGCHLHVTRRGSCSGTPTSWRTSRASSCRAPIANAWELTQAWPNADLVVGDRGPYFFPGFFLFPLFLFGAFFLIGGIFRGAGRWGGHRHGPGPWNDEGRRRFEEKADEWHRRQHGDAPPAPTTPAS